MWSNVFVYEINLGNILTLPDISKVKIILELVQGLLDQMKSHANLHWLGDKWKNEMSELKSQQEELDILKENLVTYINEEDYHALNNIEEKVQNFKRYWDSSKCAHRYFLEFSYSLQNNLSSNAEIQQMLTQQEITNKLNISKQQIIEKTKAQLQKEFDEKFTARIKEEK